MATTARNSGAWDDERTERLITLWKTGHSAGQISKLLGGVSRNAVLGKLFRMGYNRVHQNIEPRPPKMKKPTPRKTKVYNPEPACRRDTSEDTARKSFSELEDHHCRYIPAGKHPRALTGDDKMYCGLEVVPGLAWCKDHASRVYDSPKTKTVNAAAKERKLYFKRHLARSKRLLELVGGGL